jgi:hypothetical protein
MLSDPSQTAFAQTQWKGRYVETALLDQVNPQVAKPPNADFTVIAWEDRRNGNSDIYAQMIENNTGLAMWEPIDGVPVCTAVGAQINPRAAYDSLGGVIIVWEDYRDRHDTQISDTTVMDIFAHRIILSNGQLDANWSSNPDGVPVCVRTGQRSRGPRIVGTTDGAYITWTDFRNSSGEPLYQNRDVYVQYLLSATGSYPGGYNWISNGIAVTANDDDQQNPDITLDYSVDTQLGRYGAFIAYEDNQTGGVFYINSTRTLADGSSPWAPVCLDCNGPEQLHPCIAPLGISGRPFRGAVVAWETWLNSMGNLSDVFARNIKLDGQLDWGSVVCDAAGEQIRPRMAVTSNPSQNSATVVVVFEDTRDFATSGVDVYCNAFNGVTGDPYWTPTTAGLLCNEAENQLTPEIDFLDNFVVAWEDWRTGDADVYGNLLYVQDPTQLRWPGTGQAISLGKHGQLKPKVSGEVIVWQDGRRQPLADVPLDQSADTNIYAQKLGDECDLPTEMMWRDQFVKWSWASDATSHCMATDVYGNQYVAWVEGRVIGQYTIEHVFVQKFDRDGVPKWFNNGVLVSNGSEPGTNPDICVDDAEGCFVTFLQGGNLVRLAHVDFTGTLTQTVGVGAGSTPHVVEDDAGGALVGYHAGNTDVEVAHYDAGFTLLDARTVAAWGASWGGLKMSKDREGGTWLVWYQNGGAYAGTHYDGATASPPPAFLGGGGIDAIPDQFDIDTDYVPSTSPPGAGGRAVVLYDCVFAGVANDNTLTQNDVFVARLWRAVIGGVQTVRWSDEKNITNNDSGSPGSNYNAMHPAISADSLGYEWPYPTYQEIGGALVSFTNSYTDPNVQQTRYSVESFRTHWNWSGANYAHQEPFQNNPKTPLYIMQNGLTHESRSDISVRIGCIEKASRTDQVLGVVVWSTNQTQGCLSPLAIHAQLLDYSVQDIDAAKYWSQTGTPVARIEDTTEQIVPMIRSTPPGSAVLEDHPLPVLWSDSRSGTRCLLMTRVQDVAGELSWRKKDAQEASQPTTIRLLPGYPQPVSLSAHSGFTIPYTSERDATATVEFFDLLGRKAAVLPGVRLTAGSSFQYIPASAYRSLAPGLYQLSVVTAHARAQRRVVLVR